MVGGVLSLHTVRSLFELLQRDVVPPVAHVALLVIAPALVVKRVGEFVAHDDPHRPEVQTPRVLQAEERRLEEAGRKHDLVLCGRVIRVHRRWGHGPLVAVNRLVQLPQVHLQGETVVPG